MTIPEKLTFKRKEVIQLTKLEGRVLDYWENEFPAFVPVINQSGEKFYSRQDLETILKIKHFLLIEKLDKEKVKELLGLKECQPVSSVKGAGKVHQKVLQRMRGELEEILTILNKNDKK